MRFGINYLLFTTRPGEECIARSERIMELGYDGIEWPIFDLSEEVARRIGGFNRQTGFGATCNFNFPAGTCPVSEDPVERRRALEMFRSRLDLTCEIGATLLCGPLVQGLGKFTNAGPSVDEKHRCEQFLVEAGDLARERGIVLALEYLNRFEMYMANTAHQIKQLVQAVGHPSVKAMLDSFHANIEEKDTGSAIRLLGGDLVHVHVSESDRGIPGSGVNIDWDSYFQALAEIGYDNWYTIESFAQFLPDLAVAAKIWRPLYESEDRLLVEGLEFMKKRAHTNA